MKTCYGFWDGEPFDLRNASLEELPATLNIEELEFFDGSNPVDAFVSHRGFIIFNPEVSLIKVLRDYWEKASENSCGKCTPCRNGTALVYDLLKKASEDKHSLSEKDWKLIEEVCTLMAESSFCGVGQTVPVSLIGALKFFPEDLKKNVAYTSADQYSVVTAPCIEACPAKVNIPRYIDYIKESRSDLATGVLLRNYPLVGSCGRVCVHFCESACRRRKLEGPVDIKNLKRYAADSLGESVDHLFKPRRAPQNKPKVAVIGAGGAGITCAYHLLLAGYPVDIIESKDRAGGMALTGIPQYRLPKDLLSSETSKVIENLGGRVLFEREFGKDFSIDDLFNDGYKAVFLGVGCAKGTKLGFPEDEEKIVGYTDGIDFLRQVEKSVSKGRPLHYDGDTVIVGCGNVAMDCCRTAVRISSGKVSVVYRRTEQLSPADPVELHEAHQEGVSFHWLTAQKQLVVENGKVTGLLCCKLKVEGDPNSRKSKLTEIEGSEFVIPCSKVIAAIGQKLEKELFVGADKLELGKRDSIIAVNENLETSRKGVFAGGDCAVGPRSLIEAMAQGEKAAQRIQEYLEGEEFSFDKRQRVSDMIKSAGLFDDAAECKPIISTSRTVIPELEPLNRTDNFEEVELGLTDDQAKEEAERCMRCYRVLLVETANPIGKTAK